MSEPHDVVKLLVARMESHPEEFGPDDNGRWAEWLDQLLPLVTEEERVLLRGPMMQTLHEEVLDELLNGPDKRRKEAEGKNEYERHLAQSLQHMKQQQMAAQLGAPLQNAYASQLGQYNQAQAVGLAGSYGAITSDPNLSKSALEQIKQALGITK